MPYHTKRQANNGDGGGGNINRATTTTTVTITKRGAITVNQLHRPTRMTKIIKPYYFHDMITFRAKRDTHKEIARPKAATKRLPKINSNLPEIYSQVLPKAKKSTLSRNSVISWAEKWITYLKHKPHNHHHHCQFEYHYICVYHKIQQQQVVVTGGIVVVVRPRAKITIKV